MSEEEDRRILHQLVQHKSFGNEIMLSDVVWEQVKELVTDMEKATDRVEEENWWMISFAAALFAARLISSYAEDKKDFHIKFAVEILEDFSNIWSTRRA